MSARARDSAEATCTDCGSSLPAPALDARVAALDTELRTLAASTHDGVVRARLAGRPTELVSVPEPYPPPDEGTPPAPARVPEPYPPPDEGTPPQPDPVPFPAEPAEN